MRPVRLGAALALVLAGCSAVLPASDDIALPDFDASLPDATIHPDAAAPDASDATPFNGGGPLACRAGCVCDGTLYACAHATLVDGGCPGGGGPPAPLLDGGDDAADAGDAGDPGDASGDGGDAAACELAGDPCLRIPTVCLPKPTCACITQATGMTCDVDPNGNGFVLTCPPPPP